jgi:hypothetical protein
MRASLDPAHQRKNIDYGVTIMISFAIIICIRISKLEWFREEKVLAIDLCGMH